MSSKAISVCFIVVLSAITSSAQQARPDRWKGLILDQTTPDQAIAIFGQPKNSKEQKIRIQKIGDWLGKAVKQDLPHLRWENVAGMKSVDAYFINGKLAALDLWLSAEVRASALDSIYGVEFKHLISNAGRAVAGPGAYQRDRGETFSNKDEVAYHVGAKTEISFLVAWCDVGFGEGLKRAYGAGTDDSRPGKVRQIQMYARSLENREGESVLSGEASPIPAEQSAPPAQKKDKTCFENGRKVPCP